MNPFENPANPVSWIKGVHQPRAFAFLLLDEFSMMPFTSAIEPLRVANRMRGASLYSWQTVSADGGLVAASNGGTIMPDSSLAELGDVDAIVVCGGLNVYSHADHAIIAALRKASRRGVAMGSVCTGSVVLARAGLLEGRRCTIHWEELESFRENFPALTLTSRLYEIDGDRFTCSGGTSPLDMMIHFIELDFGHELAVQVADQMLHHRSREASVPQRLALPDRIGVRHSGLLDVIATMERHLEEPLALAQLARHAGLSLRQLERLFAATFQTTPARYYLKIRLERARQLVTRTAMPMAQIAVACGFASPAHFARCYREAYLRTASADRAAGIPQQGPSPATRAH